MATDRYTLGGAVWTAKSSSDANANFRFFTGRVKTAELASFTATLFIEDLSGDIAVKRAYQYSDDGVTWDTPSVFDAGSGWIASEGYAYAGSSTNIDVTRTYVRFGVAAKNVTGTTVENGRVTVYLIIQK